MKNENLSKQKQLVYIHTCTSCSTVCLHTITFLPLDPSISLATIVFAFRFLRIHFLRLLQVVQLDQSNVKAHFRRGQARQLLQDYEEAVGDFQEVLKLEPQNKAAVRQMALCKKKLKEEREKEKRRYANMFGYLGKEENGVE